MRNKIEHFFRLSNVSRIFVGNWNETRDFCTGEIAKFCATEPDETGIFSEASEQSGDFLENRDGTGIFLIIVGE